MCIQGNDLNLYEHFKECLDSIDEDGICYVYADTYEPFVEGFMHDCFDEGFNAHITGTGMLSFHIDEVKYYFDDFETFKKLIMKDFEEEER